MEKKFEIVKTFTIKLFCDECGGEMLMKNYSTKNLNTIYNYICPNCNAKITSNKIYPIQEVQLREC